MNIWEQRLKPPEGFHEASAWLFEKSPNGNYIRFDQVMPIIRHHNRMLHREKIENCGMISLIEIWRKMKIKMPERKL